MMKMFVVVLCRRIAELETTYQMAEDNSKVQIEETSARLHNKTAECSSLKLENERLKVKLLDALS